MPLIDPSTTLADADGGYLMPEKVPVRVARRGFGLLFRLVGWPYRIEYVNTARFFLGELERHERKGH